MQSGLIERHTIAELVEAYATAQAEVKEAGRLITQAQDRIKAAQLDGGYFTSFWPHGFDAGKLAEEDGQKEAAANMKRHAWRYIVDRCGIRDLMSIKDREALDKELFADTWQNRHREEKDSLPELTTEAVYSWLDGLAHNTGDLLRNSVKEVFNFLRPCRDAYKTNSQYEIGRRVIVRWGAYPATWDTRARLQYGSEGQIQAVDNVFHLLDGKGPAKYPGNLLTALREAEKGHSLKIEAETEYFRVVIHKNGNAHIEFKRADLLRELNKVGGGNALKHDTNEAKSWRAA